MEELTLRVNINAHPDELYDIWMSVGWMVYLRELAGDQEALRRRKWGRAFLVIPIIKILV